MRSSVDGNAVKKAISRAYARIYDVVSRIPKGKVMTYGQVAAAAGMPRGARVVGYAMRASLDLRPVPWQRVLGRKKPGWAQVTIKDPVGAALQRRMLEAEGVRFGERDGVDLERYGWKG
jgi:methylated-DNA-protein-cysteine methyltransferase-like protein